MLDIVYHSNTIATRLSFFGSIVTLISYAFLDDIACFLWEPMQTRNQIDLLAFSQWLKKKFEEPLSQDFPYWPHRLHMLVLSINNINRLHANICARGKQIRF